MNRLRKFLAFVLAIVCVCVSIKYLINKILSLSEN